MKKNVLVEKYSKALFQVALENKKENIVLKDLESIVKFFDTNTDIADLLTAPIVSDKVFIEIVDVVSRDLKLEKISKEFLKILCLNKRINLISDINIKCSLYKLRMNKISQFILVSSEIVSDKEVHTIKKELEESINEKVEIKQKIDSNLSGGFTLQYNSLLIDNSACAKLNEIKNLMVNKLDSFDSDTLE